jgi:hypothetical protein
MYVPPDVRDIIGKAVFKEATGLPIAMINEHGLNDRIHDEFRVEVS